MNAYTPDTEQIWIFDSTYKCFHLIAIGFWPYMNLCNIN